MLNFHYPDSNELVSERDMISEYLRLRYYIPPKYKDFLADCPLRTESQNLGVQSVKDIGIRNMPTVLRKAFHKAGITWDTRYIQEFNGKGGYCVQIECNNKDIAFDILLAIFDTTRDLRFTLTSTHTGFLSCSLKLLFSE